jgi:hypothetical protein
MLSIFFLIEEKLQLLNQANSIDTTLLPVMFASISVALSAN